jgi:excisionase family DNA binding protein
MMERRPFKDRAKPAPVIEVLGIRMWTVTEAARVFGCCQATMFRKIKTGEIKARRLGRSWRIPEAEMRKFSDTGGGVK